MTKGRRHASKTHLNASATAWNSESNVDARGNGLASPGAGNARHCTICRRVGGYALDGDGATGPLSIVGTQIHGSVSPMPDRQGSTFLYLSAAQPEPEVLTLSCRFTEPPWKGSGETADVQRYPRQTLHREMTKASEAVDPGRPCPCLIRDYDDIAASAASAARRLSRSCSRLLPASAAAASNAARASS
ncbi:hypothetical protein SAMN05428953_106239 [Mesorhizobium muleiense]|uniref:Uncharacterized protein n=1 Tax=Mesorhizobium muleiense TaxID=1004279 RepID=A0A1G8U2P8_9HYPH|nr:hypothetical protein SAMN05428953_106239 [Mesorhizobium muleiense]